MTTDNRTNEPTDEQVEWVAFAMFARHGEVTTDRWDAMHPDRQNVWRNRARKAIAALGAAPQSEDHVCGMHCEGFETGQVPVQPSSLVDEGKIAEVISSANMDYNLSDRSGESYACGAPDYRSAFIARAVVEAIGGASR